ncbi:Peroxygenase 1 [Malassezia pachydermatis]|uniref:N-acetyltransferase n=1 Tax=Malassezia pachydermatis TaxID=77020 RepID=A0A0M9VR68_9BASI|nr:n-acetyltransferase [Malassezia pachydermatis]KOS16283.1 n-acetyltransferase [Malassezia pachydermatis]
MVTPKIRDATPEDIPTILHFIQQLAIYEKALDQVEATEELLKETLFTNPYARCIIAEIEDGTQGLKPVGFSLYFFAYSTWTARPTLFLEDLFVLPEHRNAGIGKHLFKRLGEIAKENKCPRVDWHVLDWNAPSIAFYEKSLGAKMHSEWRLMRLERDGIERLANFI